MAGLGGEDGACDGDVRSLGDHVGRAEVGGDTDVLDDRREAHEGLGVDDRGEGVGAWLGRGGSERAREESDMLSLVACDVLDSVADPIGVTGFLEVGLGELAKEMAVEAGDTSAMWSRMTKLAG